METITACFCCRKKIHKRNEFQGLEGMVKLKYSEDNIHNEPNNVEVENSNTNLMIQNDNNPSITSSGDTESKRASSVPQRSLPDIPITEPTGNNDNYSDLYATVADKVERKPSPTPSLEKHTSISQHSSISQADVNSPYATVKNSSHGYDKVRKTNEEHPYAQLNAPVSSRNSNLNNKENPYENTDETEDKILPSNNTNQNTSDASSTESENSPQENIPAAAAMLGMISASQELPYMTPPIVPQPNFSGDSQDSSKGYTSISVREPLANIIAQTKQQQRLSSKQRNDSHYATVSDDSDEMYAAIEDPNNQGDIYNSGSETYAQIQPTNQLVVVQINNQSHQTPVASNSNQTISISTVMSNVSRRSGLDNFDHPSTIQTTSQHSNVNTNQTNDQTPIPPTVDSLFAMHSRQASSSSNVSYIGNIGSPKPEKRQANSPLPPTPKNGNSFSNLSNQSGRNSAVVEESPPKDIDGMYAKVMKNRKYTNTPSQNNSPILSRRQLVANEKNAELKRSNSFKQTEHLRPRSDSFDKLSGNNLNLIENRKSEGGYSVVRTLFPDISVVNEKTSIIVVEPGYESLPDTSSLTTNDPGYETLLKNRTLSVANNNNKGSKPNSDYDPNYEVLQPFNTNKIYTNTSGDDGYAKVLEKPTNSNNDKRPSLCINSNIDIEDDDSIAGYSKVKERTDKNDESLSVGYTKIKDKTEEKDDDEDTLAGYSKVKERKIKEDDDLLDGYSKVKERKINIDIDVIDGYSKVKERKYDKEDDDDIIAGYSKVKERKEIEDDEILSGYSKVKERKNKIVDDDNLPGYSSIKDILNKTLSSDLENHGYASISEAKQLNDISNYSKNNNNNINNNNNRNNSNINTINNVYNINNNNNNNNNNEYKLNDNITILNDNKISNDKCADIYSTIQDKNHDNDDIKYSNILKIEEEHKYSTIGTKNSIKNKNSLSQNQLQQQILLLKNDIPPPLPPVGTRSPELLLQTNKNLENSINYIKKENPYEKVKDITDCNNKLTTTIPKDVKITTTNVQENGSVLVVDDYFQV